MKKKLPKLKTDRAVENLLAKDISAYLEKDNLFPGTFEFAAKDKVVNLRMSEGLLEALKRASKKAGVPYQKFIRGVLERAVGSVS